MIIITDPIEMTGGTFKAYLTKDVVDRDSIETNADAKKCVMLNNLGVDA